jgi:hypothetical protein
MVAGDICEPPPELEPEPWPTEADEFEDNASNAFAEFWVTPVVGVDDDFDDVSALRASMADDAAPRANNMAELRQGRTQRPTDRSCACFSASAVPCGKTQ